MTADKQPRALYLADVLAAGFECDQEWYEIESAKELRRLHAENVQLQAGYEAVRLEIESMRAPLGQPPRQPLPPQADIPLTPDQLTVFKYGWKCAESAHGIGGEA